MCHRGYRGIVYITLTKHCLLKCKLDDRRAVEGIINSLLYCWTVPEKMLFNLYVCFHPWREPIVIIVMELAVVNAD